MINKWKPLYYLETLFKKLTRKASLQSLKIRKTGTFYHVDLENSITQNEYVLRQ